MPPTHHRSRNTKSVLERFEEAGKTRSKSDGESHDGIPQDCDELWERTLSLSLCCEPHFLELMRNRSEVLQFEFRKPWLACIHLPHRYARYENFDSFMASWFHGLNKGDRIIELAIETLLGLFGELPHTKGVGTVKSPPIDNEASLQKRQSMFEFQVAHQRVLEAMKSLQDFESQTIHSTADGVLASTDQNAIRAIDTWIDTLRDIDATNVRSRDQLKNCKVNNTGIAVLDGLINAHIRRGPCSPLFLMPSDEDKASAKKRLSDSSSSYWSNAETVAATLKDVYDFEPEYYLNRKSSQKTQPVSVEATKASGPMQVSYSQSAKVVVDEVQYAIHDTNTAEASTNPMIAVVPLTCFKWLASMTAEIDVSRFKLNYEMFEQCVNRPDAFANPATRLKDNAIVRQKHGRLYMAQDNVYQIRALLDLICENHLCVGSDTFPRTLDLRRLYESTERMWALLSIMHGCVEEPAIWLTVMDGLLARLAESICGHADPAHETITMCFAQEILAYATDGDLPQLPSRNPQTSPKSLKRDNFARNVFAELAGLYRGAVLLSFADASIPRSFPSRDSSQYKEWYEQLIPWHGQCGNSACFDRLKAEYRPDCKIQDRSLAVDVSDARVHERKIWSFTVGVPTERVRKRKIRTSISLDREMAYPCLFDIIEHCRFSPGLGPFFHYFAHSWYPQCKPAHGKDGLMADFDAVSANARKRRGEGSQSSEQFSDSD